MLEYQAKVRAAKAKKAQKKYQETIQKVGWLVCWLVGWLAGWLACLLACCHTCMIHSTTPWYLTLVVHSFNHQKKKPRLKKCAYSRSCLFHDAVWFGLVWFGLVWFVPQAAVKKQVANKFRPSSHKALATPLLGDLKGLLAVSEWVRVASCIAIAVLEQCF